MTALTGCWLLICRLLVFGRFEESYAVFKGVLCCLREPAVDKVLRKVAGRLVLAFRVMYGDSCPIGVFHVVDSPLRMPRRGENTFGG